MIKKIFVLLIPFLLLSVGFGQFNSQKRSIHNSLNNNFDFTSDPFAKCRADGCILPMYVGVITLIMIFLSVFPIVKIIMGVIKIFTIKDPLLKHQVGIKHIKRGIHWLIAIILLWIGMYFLYLNTLGLLCHIDCHPNSFYKLFYKIYNLGKGLINFYQNILFN